MISEVLTYALAEIDRYLSDPDFNAPYLDPEVVARIQSGRAQIKALRDELVLLDISDKSRTDPEGPWVKLLNQP